MNLLFLIHGLGTKQFLDISTMTTRTLTPKESYILHSTTMTQMTNIKY